MLPFALTCTDGLGVLPFTLIGLGTTLSFALASAALPFALTGTLPIPAVAVSTDSEEDRLHGYVTLVIRGHKLCIINIDEQLCYPICPSLVNWQWTYDTAKTTSWGS
jgi:hypothetical protein